MLDVLIKGGRIVDGTGCPWFRADVGIQGDRIATIRADLDPAEAGRVIDAAGLVVAPGFVDMHCHSEYTILRRPENEFKVRQGVTTECVSQVLSPGPLRRTAVDEATAELVRLGLSLEWDSLDGYFRRLERPGAGNNIASYISYATIRKGAIGDTNRHPEPAELDAMKGLLAEGMQDGGLGLVANLYNSDAIYATTDELVELCGVAARHGGIFCVGLRDESDAVLESLDEAIEIGRRAEIAVEILHMKVAGPENWDNSAAYVERVERARDEGVDIRGNLYPYTAASLPLAASLPHWVREGGAAACRDRLADPAVRDRLRAEYERPWRGQFHWMRAAGGWRGVTLDNAPDGFDKSLQGLPIEEIGLRLGLDPTDAALELIARGIEVNDSPTMIVHAMREDDVERFLGRPWSSVCSDSDGIAGRGHKHPRFYGTFPRVLGHYRRDRGLFSLEEAVRKLSFLGAVRLGLHDRGLVHERLFADLVVFDPDTVRERGTYADPHHFPEGIRYVLVNGQVVVDPTGHTGALPGRGLRR